MNTLESNKLSRQDPAMKEHYSCWQSSDAVLSFYKQHISDR